MAITSTAVLALMACKGTAPPATPQDLTGFVTELVRRHVAVVKTISGDPGCADASLVPNGVHLRVSLAPDPTVYDAYLFRFKNEATWSAAASKVAACAAQGPTTATAAADGSLITLSASPFRAFGVGWSSALRAAIDGALRAAAAGGNDPGAGQPEG
jgi:hypothetical protein